MRGTIPTRKRLCQTTLITVEPGPSEMWHTRKQQIHDIPESRARTYRNCHHDTFCGASGQGPERIQAYARKNPKWILTQWPGMDVKRLTLCPQNAYNMLTSLSPDAATCLPTAYKIHTESSRMLTDCLRMYAAILHTTH